MRPYRRNTFFNWFAPGGTVPYANRLYRLYRVARTTGRGIPYELYTPYQQSDNADLTALSGPGDLPANGWELLAYDLGYTERG